MTSHHTHKTHHNNSHDHNHGHLHENHHGLYRVAKDASSKVKHGFFRIVIKPHTKFQYVLWSCFAAIFGISLAYFVVQI